MAFILKLKDGEDNESFLWA